MADLDFQLLIQSDANLSGFKKAEEATGKLADQANKAAPKTDKLAKATKKVGVDAGFTGARVATLSNELLRWTGMGAQGTAVSTGLSSAFVGVGDSAKLLGVAIGGATIGVAFLLPLLVEWWQKTSKVTAANAELRKQMADQFPELDDLAAKIGHVVDGLNEQAAAARSLATIQIEKEIRKTAEAIETQQDELRRLTDGEDSYFERLKQRFGIGQSDKELTEARMLAIRELVAQIEGERGKLKELEQALANSTSVGQQRTEALEAETAATQDLVEATEEWFATQGRNQDVAIETYNLRAELAEQQARDAEDDMRAEGKRQDAQARAEIKRDTEVTLAHIANRKAIAVVEQRLAAQKKQQTLNGVADFTAAASVLFSKNKGLAIAAALADTYAGANAAFAQTPGPVWVKAAAAALAVALGIANVQSIRKSELGFDDPVNDLLAAKLGRKFATDVLSHINAGFGAGLTDLSGGPRGSSVQNVNRTTNNSYHLGGFFGTDETQLLKQLNRKLTKISRLENRTKVTG